MKLTAILLFATCLQVSAKGYAQSVTLSEKNATLEKVFRKIKNQSGYTFVYRDEWLKKAGKVDIDLQNAPIEQALEACFKNQPLTYTLVKTTVVVRLKPTVGIQPTVTNENPLPPPIFINGRVTDENGKPLQGVSVVVVGDKKGVQTDENGNFAITVSENAILRFSYVGFETVEVPVKNRTTIEVKLVVTTSALADVVVTALGISRKKKSLVYATQSVKASELTEVRDPNNVLNSLQGKVANVLITQSSEGGVGGNARFVLRGNRSIQGGNNALIVVDGIPGDVTGIQPDNIESISILPGASAAALYGTAAGNGVIVITTKKGSNNKMSVSVNSGVIFESPFVLPKVQNIYGQGSGGILDASAGNSWGPKMTGQSYTNHLGNQSSYSAQPDNIKDFFRDGVSLNNSISVSGGSEKAQTFLSYTNNRVQGIIPGNDLLSHIINLRLTNQISKRFSTDAKVTYLARDIKNMPREGLNNVPVLDLYQIPRNVSTADAKQYEVLNNIGIQTATPWPATLNFIYQNPYWENNRDLHSETRDNVVGFLRAKYQLTDWLNITGGANLDRSSSRRERSIYDGVHLWANYPGGNYSRTTDINTQKWFDVILEGNNIITKDIKVNYHAGAIYTDRRFDQTSASANGLNVTNRFSLNFATTPVVSQSGNEVQTQSVFGQVALSYKDAIFIDASSRNDWVSVLPPPHSFQYYSVGASVVLSDIISLPRKISFLKVNLNYAEVGNGGQFGLLTSSYFYSQGAGNGFISRGSTLPFPDLKPEIVKSIEAGIEARFFSNRVGFTLNLYKSNSINQLLTLSAPVATGYNTRYINAGNIQNKGIELLVNAFPIKKKDYTWVIDFNLGINRNKVIKIADNLKTVYLGLVGIGAVPQVKEGGSFGDLVGDQWYKNNKGQYVVNAGGAPQNAAALGMDRGFIGNPNPKATIGLTNTFTYKRFSLRILLDGRIGGEIVSGTEINLSYSGITEATAQYREGGWNLGAVDLNGQPVSTTISSQYFWQTVSGKRDGVAEFYTYDVTSFRARELSLGYNIPLKSNKFIKTARLSAIARNLFWLYRGSSKLNIPGLSKRKMWFDPDMTVYGGNGQGYDVGAMPSTRSLGVNLQISF